MWCDFRFKYKMPKDNFNDQIWKRAIYYSSYVTISGYVAYGSFGFGIGAIFLVSIWWKHNEYLAFLNLLVKTPAKNDKGIDDTFSKMIPWIVPAAYSQCMCNSILFIKRSNGVQYFWGILNPAWQTDTIFVLSALYEFVTALNSWNSALFVFFTYSCYTHYLGVYLKKLG